MKTGFIGLGNMGRRMATRLIGAGFPLAVHDVSRAAAGSLEKQGAVWVNSPRAMAEQCGVICTSLPGPEEMEAVALARNGILAGARSGSILIDHTTNSPASVRNVHDQLLAKGVHTLDAPVSGGVGGAEAGTLTILVGGDSEALAKCKPILRAYGKEILHVGEVGAGCTAKVLHNLAVLSANLATVECLTVGVKAGVDPKMLIEVFQKCTLGKNLDLQVSLPATLFQGNFEPRFALKMAHKDMKLATELARTHGVPITLNEVCEQEVDLALSRGWGERDNNIFLTLQEERAGVQVRVDR